MMFTVVLLVLRFKRICLRMINRSTVEDRNFARTRHSLQVMTVAMHSNLRKNACNDYIVRFLYEMRWRYSFTVAS